jgi:hypothetical protein
VYGVYWVKQAPLCCCCCWYCCHGAAAAAVTVLLVLLPLRAKRCRAWTCCSMCLAAACSPLLLVLLLLVGCSLACTAMPVHVWQDCLSDKGTRKLVNPRGCVERLRVARPCLPIGCQKPMQD